MSDTRLLNCPFCGGEAEIRTNFVHQFAVCKECTAVSDYKNAEAEAISAWNRRTPPAAVPEPWGWLCNGKGDIWEERDKVVRDPELIARYRERPDLWRIEPLYLGSPPAAVPDGWVMVPRRPDENMKSAVRDIAGPEALAYALAGWNTFISAAPAAPTEPQE